MKCPRCGALRYQPSGSCWRCAYPLPLDVGAVVCKVCKTRGLMLRETLTDERGAQLKKIVCVRCGSAETFRDIPPPVERQADNAERQRISLMLKKYFGLEALQTAQKSKEKNLV